MLFLRKKNIDSGTLLPDYGIEPIGSWRIKNNKWLDMRAGGIPGAQSGLTSETDFGEFSAEETASVLRATFFELASLILANELKVGNLPRPSW